MPFNYTLLLSKIIEKCGNQYNFATAMNLSERSVSLKLNGKVGWKQKEIMNALNVLDLKVSDISKYFFNQ